MRTAFLKTLQSLAREDERIELIVGDLGFGVIEPFVAEFPDRFLNVGVAEQNMTGIATGLALSGSIVFTYSIGNFPTLRCLEQLRNDVCYHRANVKVVAVGGGLAYGPLGVSHHATEDLAILRAIPNLAVAAPGDPLEAAAITRAISALPGPAYLRLGKAGEPVVHDAQMELHPGCSLLLEDGGDLTIMSSGGILASVVDAATRLRRTGLDVRVLSAPWLFPFDEEAVRRAARETRLVVTVEEHSIVGGLGGAVAEVLAACENVAPLLRIGLPREFTSVVGSQEYLRKVYGLDPESIAARIQHAFEERDDLARSLR